MTNLADTETRSSDRRREPVVFEQSAHEVHAWRWCSTDERASLLADVLPLTARAGRWYLDAASSPTGEDIRLPASGWLIEHRGVIVVLNDDAFRRWAGSLRPASDGGVAAGHIVASSVALEAAVAEGYD